MVIYLFWNGEERVQMGEQSLLREKENRESLLIVRGKSREPNLRIGGRAKLSDINDKAMETYRILEIVHHHNGNEYYNEFVGIPDVFHPPYQDNFALPRSEEQVAKVMDNADPKGMGRIRVQMRWQEKHNEKTPWIRMLQPHAGSGKGFYFVPELGEEVLVGFEGGNAEKPYIIGTHYNGKEKSGYAEKSNRYKVLQTRSNSRLLLDDETGDVKLESQKGQTIAIFYGDGNIEITAPENISISAGKSVSINAGENININAGMNISTSAVMNYTQMVGVNYTSTIAGNASHFITGKLFELIEGDVESIAESDRKDFGKGKIEMISENDIKQQAEKSIINNSGETSNMH